MCINVLSITNHMHTSALFDNMLAQYGIPIMKFMTQLLRKCKEELLVGHLARNYDYHSSVTPMFTLAHFAILLERASYSYIDYYCFTNLYTTYNTTSLHS